MLSCRLLREDIATFMSSACSNACSKVWYRISLWPHNLLFSLSSFRVTHFLRMKKSTSSFAIIPPVNYFVTTTFCVTVFTLLWTSLLVSCQQQYFRVKPQSNVEVIQGSTVILNCAVGSQAGEAQWSKNGFVLGETWHCFNTFFTTCHPWQNERQIIPYFIDCRLSIVCMTLMSYEWQKRLLSLQESLQRTFSSVLSSSSRWQFPDKDHFIFLGFPFLSISVLLHFFLLNLHPSSCHECSSHVSSRTTSNLHTKTKKMRRTVIHATSFSCRPDAQDRVHLPPLFLTTRFSVSGISFKKRRKEGELQTRRERERRGFMFLVIHTEREVHNFFNMKPPLETGWRRLNYVYKLKTIALRRQKEIKDSSVLKERCYDGNQRKGWLTDDLTVRITRRRQDWWEGTTTDDVRLDETKWLKTQSLD